MADDGRWWESAPVIGGGLQFIGNLIGNGGQEQPEYPDPLKSNLYNVNPVQQRLYQTMVGRYNKGLGDYGFGGGVKQGMSQLRQMMGDRGITPDSGVYQAGQSNIISQAMAAASRNRQQYGMGLLGTQMQVASATGRNRTAIDNPYGKNNFLWGNA